MRRVIEACCLVALVGTLAGCGSDGATSPAPTSASFSWRIRLISPFGAEGAAAIEFRSAATSFEAAQQTILTRRVDDRVQAAIFRRVPGDISFIATSGVDSPPVDLRVVQVADGAGRLRASLSGYALVVEVLP